MKDKIAVSFGKGVLDAAGKIECKRLADVAFADGEKLSVLNGIMHPPVLERVEQLIVRYNRLKQVDAIVLDMALLVEVGWAGRCDKLVFCGCGHS